MKTKYKNKLRLVKKYLSWDEGLDEKTFNKYADDGFDIMRSLAKTKDVEVLSELLDLFNKKTEWYGGVCETLMNDIWNNYTADQIIEAISVKFDYLIKNDLSRFACLCNILFNQEDFVKFRKMFNKIKSNNSDKFLDELSKWIDSDYEVGLEGIALLREDVRKWK